MRVVLDTNVLISALLLPSSAPAELLTRWRNGRFTLLTAQEQLDELMRVLRYEKIRARLSPTLAGRLINELRDLATLVDGLAPVDACADPFDNYLLAIASAGVADFLITGDKRDLLSLVKYDGARIVSVSGFLAMRKGEHVRAGRHQSPVTRRSPGPLCA